MDNVNKANGICEEKKKSTTKILCGNCVTHTIMFVGFFYLKFQHFNCFDLYESKDVYDMNKKIQ